MFLTKNFFFYLVELVATSNNFKHPTRSPLAAYFFHQKFSVQLLFLSFYHFLTNPIWHMFIWLLFQICDKIRYLTIVSIMGNIFMVTAFILIGPLPFIPLEPSVSLIQGVMALFGLGYGMVMVSTFGRSQRAAIRKGYNDDMDTYLIISGNYLLSTFTWHYINSVGI